MATNWWINDSGLNLLSGIEGDENNPAILPDSYIIDFLTRYPAARRGFNDIVPSMLPDEQIRMQAIAQRAQNQLKDDQQYQDQFQVKLNTAGIRTAGKNGGHSVFQGSAKFIAPRR